jgi:predicted aspartyl protease
MKSAGENDMGRFAVEFEVANDLDMASVKTGALKPEKVRRLTIRGVVDSGATHLVLPKSVADQLQLLRDRKVKVVYADRRSAVREIADRVHVRVLDRQGTFQAIIEPRRNDALIGANVLETFDLLPDCSHQRLLPRDPKYITAELD